jgi:hypothetical protein
LYRSGFGSETLNIVLPQYDYLLIIKAIYQKHYVEKRNIRIPKRTPKTTILKLVQAMFD